MSRWNDWEALIRRPDAAVRVNAVAPLLVAQQFLGFCGLPAAPSSSTFPRDMAQSRPIPGFPYYYSASKAALNMFMRTLAADAKRWGIITVLLDPGWVSTDMGGPGTSRPRRRWPAMLRLIDALTPSHNGRFLTWQGDEQDW